MNTLPGLDFSSENLQALAKTKAEKKGILTRELLERFEVAPPFVRQFQVINFHSPENEIVSTGLIDVELALYVKELEESLLLWRPRYAGLLSKDSSEYLSEGHSEKESETALSSVIMKLLETRTSAKNKLLELGESVSKIKADWGGASSLFMPKSFSSIKKGEETLRTKRFADGMLSAISLVINCERECEIDSTSFGRHLGVETVIIRYTGVQDNSVRLLALESPAAQKLSHTLTNGRALTRLLEINTNCRDFVLKRSSI